MKKTKLYAAIKYQSIGFSVIPVKHDKKPYIKWGSYQTKAASEKQIRSWWDRWPEANVGLITGKGSNLIVLDADSQDGQNAISEFTPDTLLIPTVKTPRGFHNYFEYQTGLRSGPANLRDCDIKADGGYIIAPPSKNGEGQAYKWLEGLKITDVKPPAMPDMLFEFLQSGTPAGSTSTYINKIASSREGHNTGAHNKEKNERNKTQQGVTKRNISFKEPGRDETLFHLANHLVKSGMPIQEIEIFMNFIAQNCTPPFSEKETLIKIDSALKRSKKLDRNLTQEIREWISITNRNFSVTFLWQAQQIVTKEDKAKVRTILNRFVKDGVIEKTDQAGVYRRIEADCEPEDWQNACTESVNNLWLPFELSEIVEVMPGDIILIAGSQNAGKSALMMNMAKENRDKYSVHYFSSELRPGSFKRRMKKFPDVMPNQLNINFYQRSSNWVDVIKTGPGNLNLIDYIELHDNFYLISKILSQLHDKLNGALLIAAIQKDPKSLHGRGGSFTQEKPVLSLALDHGVATISKCKEWRENYENPNKMQYKFKIIDGCRLKKEQGWHRPIE